MSLKSGGYLLRGCDGEKNRRRNLCFGACVEKHKDKNNIKGGNQDISVAAFVKLQQKQRKI